MVYDTQITVVNGVHKGTYNWAGPRCYMIYIYRSNTVIGYTRNGCRLYVAMEIFFYSIEKAFTLW